MNYLFCKTGSIPRSELRKDSVMISLISSKLCKRSFRCLTKYENHVKNCEGKPIKPKIPQVCKKWYFVSKIVL